jgi:hypothetical protein
MVNGKMQKPEIKVKRQRMGGEQNDGKFLPECWRHEVLWPV